MRFRKLTFTVRVVVFDRNEILAFSVYIHEILIGNGEAAAFLITYKKSWLPKRCGVRRHSRVKLKMFTARRRSTFFPEPYGCCSGKITKLQCDNAFL